MSCNYYRGKCLFLNGKEDGCKGCPIKKTYNKGVRDTKKDGGQQGEWIPVSKRLPKEEDYRPCYGLPDGCVMWQTDNGVVGFGWYYNSTKCWSDIYDHPITAGKVIAWQPLPESYKEGGAEE